MISKFIEKLFSSEKATSLKTNPEENENISNNTAEIRKKIIGCLLGLAIGDAKGMAAESKGVTYSQKVANNFDYMNGYLPAGHYTDDTHHALILGKSLIETGDFDPDNFMKKLSNMDLSRGYGPTTIKSILRYQSGLKHTESGLASPGNGPSMRIAPLAILYHQNKDLLRKYAKEFKLKSKI